MTVRGPGESDGPSRRQILAGLGAGLVMAAGTARAAENAAPPPSLPTPGAIYTVDGQNRPLKDIARDRGIVYGTTVMVSQLLPQDSFTALLKREVAAIVPENEMKWSEMIDETGAVRYDIADRLVQFARANRMLVRGHNLLWFWRTPKAFEAITYRAAAQDAMLLRVHDLAGRYRGRIDSWDVVNEPVNPFAGRPDDLRTEVFLKQVGPEYLDLAYRAAREADPQARLVLNDYDVEYDTPDMDKKRAAVLRVCERMLKAGTPLDALGVEGHLSVGRHRFSAKKFADFLAEAAKMGLEIQITELDCTDERAAADPDSRDLAVADEYRRVLEVALDQKAVTMVVTWGLSDRYSWIVRHEDNDEKQRRDGMIERPLPFDRDLKPKLVWTALANAFASAPVRAMAPDRAAV
jgi:endo-1,4-beta-xylanase